LGRAVSEPGTGLLGFRPHFHARIGHWHGLAEQLSRSSETSGQIAFFSGKRTQRLGISSILLSKIF
jgi:hypothetical protein